MRSPNCEASSSTTGPEGDIGRPEVIELIFRRGQRRGSPADGDFKTKIVTHGTEVNVNAFYRHSRIKQYLKDGRALRIGAVVNDRSDLGCLRRLHNDGSRALALRFGDPYPPSRPAIKVRSSCC